MSAPDNDPIAQACREWWEEKLKERNDNANEQSNDIEPFQMWLEPVLTESLIDDAVEAHSTTIPGIAGAPEASEKQKGKRKRSNDSPAALSKGQMIACQELKRLRRCGSARSASPPEGRSTSPKDFVDEAHQVYEIERLSAEDHLQGGSSAEQIEIQTIQGQGGFDPSLTFKFFLSTNRKKEKQYPVAGNIPKEEAMRSKWLCVSCAIRTKYEADPTDKEWWATFWINEPPINPDDRTKDGTEEIDERCSRPGCKVTYKITEGYSGKGFVDPDAKNVHVRNTGLALHNGGISEYEEGTCRWLCLRCLGLKVPNPNVTKPGYLVSINAGRYMYCRGCYHYKEYLSRDEDDLTFKQPGNFYLLKGQDEEGDQ